MSHRTQRQLLAYISSSFTTRRSCSDAVAGYHIRGRPNVHSYRRKLHTSEKSDGTGFVERRSASRDTGGMGSLNALKMIDRHEVQEPRLLTTPSSSSGSLPMLRSRYLSKYRHYVRLDPLLDDPRRQRVTVMHIVLVALLAVSVILHVVFSLKSRSGPPLALDHYQSL